MFFPIRFKVPKVVLDVSDLFFTFTTMNCLTPGENELLLLPEVQAAIAALDLVPVPSKAYKTNLAIGARIDQWLSDAQKAPASARSTPRTASDLWLVPIVDPGAFNSSNCPF